jgi:hypothetical protein
MDSDERALVGGEVVKVMDNDVRAMNQLLNTCLRQMRNRLCWRKWTRTCYGQAPPTVVEIQWLRANNAVQIFQHPLVQNYFALDLVLPKIVQSDDANIVRAELMKHYELYLSWGDEKRFLLWYVESLRRLFTPPVNNEMIEQYRTSYFRLTYTIDFSTRTIDDSSLWYFVRCVLRGEESLTDKNIGGATLLDQHLQEERWAQILRLTTMLNSPDKELNINQHTILDDMRLSFEILRKQSIADLPRCGQHLGTSMINVIDEFEWFVSWKYERGPIYTRLAPVANAVQLTVKKIEKDYDNVSGLEYERKRPIFNTDESIGTRCLVQATNVILDSSSLDVTRFGQSFFLLHEKQPHLVSIFIRPDQDPSVPYVFDLFNQSECESASARYSLRWIVAAIGSNAITFTKPMLMLLLRDIDNLLTTARFRVDNFLSREATTVVAAATEQQLSPAIYSSELIEDKSELWNVLSKEKIVLHGKPLVGYYAPTDDHLFQHENHKFIPWSLNRPDLMQWKAYSASAIESMDTFRANQISRLVQCSKDQLYSLTDRLEVERYLASAPISLDIPMERLLLRPPLRIFKVVGKRVFALEDGLVFVSTFPLKFIEKLPKQEDLDQLRMYNDTDCARLRGSSRKRYTCFERSELDGSEIWFPLASKRKERSYRGVNTRIAPLIDWLDEVIVRDE